MLDPIHRTDWNIQTFVTSRAIIVGYDHLVSEVDYLASFLLVYLLVRLRVHSVQADYQLLPVLVGYASDIFKEIFHAKRVFVVGCDEGGRKKDTLIVWVGINVFHEVHDASPLFVFGACKEEDVSLHSVDVDPGYDLNVGIGLPGPCKVLFTVMSACL